MELTPREIERFHQGYEKSISCWIWKSSKFSNGYGYIPTRRNGKRTNLQAHRISYYLHKGILEDGLVVCHKCDIKDCVNPDHLFQGTVSENSIDHLTKEPLSKVVTSCAKLSPEQVLQIRSVYGIKPTAEIAEEFGVTKSNVWLIGTRKTWTRL